MNKIDIIVPIYNAKDSISRLLDSLERQKNSVFLVCIVDDGSTDGTASFCEEIAARYSYPIKVITQENQGPGIARRTGFLQTDAEYILFCDADDYLDDHALNTICAALEETPVNVLEFGFQKVTPDGKPIKSKQLKSEYIKTGALEHYLRQGNTTNFLWNKVFRRSVIRDTDFQKLFYSEDAVALANIFARTEHYRIIENKLYNYVISGTSACGQKYSLKRLDMLKADREIEKIVRRTDETLLPHAAFNTCVHITKLYVGLSREGLLDPALKKELKDAFEPNYALVKAEKSVYKGRSFRQKCAVSLFHRFPAVLGLFG